MRISLCLLLFSVVHGGGCKEMEVAAIAGESIQLQPVKLPEPWAEMTWDVTLDSAQTYGIVTFNKGEPPDLGSSPHFISRVTFHPENLSLQIDPIKKLDNGLYTLIIDIGGGREDITKFRVSVFDRVRQPNLMVLSANLELGQCNVTLSCSVPGADRVTYSWSRGTSWIPSERDHQLPGNQSLLYVVINANSSDIFYRCNASNQVSWATNTVDGKSLCDSTDFFQKVPLWAIVAAGLGLLLLLMALALIFLCKHRKKRSSSKDSDSPLTIYEEVEDSCPRRNANGNAQSRIVGNTIYAEINSNPQVADFTVYAAVQRPPSVKRKKINPSFISTIYSEVQEAPSRPRHPQKQRSSSPNPGHLYS